MPAEGTKYKKSGVVRAVSDFAKATRAAPSSAVKDVELAGTMVKAAEIAAMSQSRRVWYWLRTLMSHRM